MNDGLYVPLAGGNLALEPLVERHREGLRAACAQDTQIWAIYPHNYLGADFDLQFERLLASAPQRRVYAVLVDGVVAGMTGWLEHGAPGWSIEIGNSFIVPALRGTGCNGRIKRLMIDHAFSCGLARVVFKVDQINARSQAAVRKLGAQAEGLMRHERRTWTGRVRDTVLFSLLRHEWQERQP